MIAALARLRGRLAEWWAVDPPEERIEGSGKVHLDPAYNGRYTAERTLQELANADEDPDQTDQPSDPPAKR